MLCVEVVPFWHALQLPPSGHMRQEEDTDQYIGFPMEIMGSMVLSNGKGHSSACLTVGMWSMDRRIPFQWTAP
jgi:hypothetical protein